MLFITEKISSLTKDLFKMKKIIVFILIILSPEISFTQDEITTTNEKVISEEEIYETPEFRIDKLVGYSSGTIYINDSRLIGKGYTIRGGGIYETDVQIDGISLMNELTQIPTIPLNRNHIQEIQIQTGGFNTEYGNLRSGLINIVLKSGSFNKNSGVFETRISPASVKHYGISPYSEESAHWKVFAGPDAMKGINYDKVYHPDYNPDGKFPYPWVGWDNYADYFQIGANHAFELWKWRHRPMSYGNTPDVMIDAGFGGPVPAVKNLKFYFSQFYNKSEYTFPRSRNYSDELSSIIKLTKKINTNTDIIFSGLFNYTAAISPGTRIYNGLIPGIPSSIMTGDDKIMSANSFDYGYLYQQAAYNPSFSRYYTANLKVIRRQTEKTTYENSINIAKYDFGRNPMRSTDKEPVKFIVDEKLNKEFEYNEFPWGYPGTVGPRYDQQGLFRFIGYPGGRGRQNNDYTILTFKSRINTSFKEYHYFTAGAEINLFNLNERTEYNISSPTDPIEEKSYAWIKYNAIPREYNLFFQGKIQTSNTTAFIGLRTNYYNPNCDGFSLNRDDINSENYLGFSSWGYKEGEGTWGFAKMRTRKIKNKLRIMTRIGVARIFMKDLKIFFNFGHYYSRPDPRLMYAVLPTKYIGSDNTHGAIPQPDILWPKTVSYEFGASYNIKNRVKFQISMYNKDITNQITQLDIYGYYYKAMKTYNNTNFVDTNGIELSLIKDFGRFINFHANYNYMKSSYGFSGIKEINLNPAIGTISHSVEEVSIDPLPYFNLYLNLRTPPNWGSGKEIFGIKPLSEWSASILFRIDDRGNYLVNPDAPLKNRLYVNIEDRKTLSFYIRKSLTRGIDFFMQIINPLGWKQLNLNGISDFDYYIKSLHFPWEEGADKGNDKLGTWDRDYIYTGFFDWTKFYPDKRDIYFGIRYRF